MTSRWSRLRSSLHHVRRNALHPTGDLVSRSALLDMLAHNWHLGLTSFGGPTVHFQIFHDLFVERYRWLDETAYQEMFALCQALSGPASTKMIYAVNVLHYNFWVGVAAFFLWSAPMAITAFGLALGVGRIGEQLPGPTYALLSGINSATVGIIALAAVQLSNKAITDTVTRLLVFLGAAAGTLYNALWYFPVVIDAGGVVTVVWDVRLFQRLWKTLRNANRAETLGSLESIPVELQSVEQRARSDPPSSLHARQRDSSSAAEQPHSHPEQPLNPPQPQVRHLGTWKTGTLTIAAFFASFLTVMVCRGTLTTPNRGFALFSNLYLAGTIIFGGGPVVVPLLREYIVAPGWVAPRDFLLGLAITQAFPGPNFNFAVYLGTLAVRNTTIPSPAGALIAFLALFTPGLWLHTGFMSIWPHVRKQRVVRACVRGVHAAAVGLVFTAVYRLFEIGYLDDEVQNGASLSRDPWWVVVVATSFVGGKHFGLAPPWAILLGAGMGLVWWAVVRG